MENSGSINFVQTIPNTNSGITISTTGTGVIGPVYTMGNSSNWRDYER